MNYKRLTRFLGLKVVRLIILLIIVAAVSFILVDMSPIDPVKSYLANMVVTSDQVERLNSYWGVGQPLSTKIINWVSSVFQGDLGTSLIFRAPVTEVIADRFTASLALMFTSWLISGVLGFILGIIAAMKRGSIIDKAIKVYCYILQSAPTFWLALIFLIVFSVQLGWFPTGLGVPVGVNSSDVSIFDLVYRLILPAFTLSLLGVAQIAMYTRDKLNSVLSEEYITFSKVRGESEWGIIKNHGIRNILLPAVTLQFLSFSELFGGAVLVEQVFSYPGLGQAAVSAGLRSDIPLLLGIVIFSTIFVFCGNAIADLIYKFVDPRIRESERDEI